MCVWEGRVNEGVQQRVLQERLTREEILASVSKSSCGCAGIPVPSTVRVSARHGPSLCRVYHLPV